MKISFLDVGQGDSIIIEWKDADEVAKIGIIDCNLRGKENPVLEYIKSKNYKEVAFIILSHPHSDHYSGFLELLNYLDHTGIKILRMCHTLGFSGVEAYWKYFEVNSKDNDLLSAIKNKWFELEKKKHILRMDMLVDGKVMRIDNRVSITCLSPSHAEIKEYQQKVKLDEVKNEKEASRAANLLSTMLKLTFDDYNYLLTSDTENFAFIGVLEREKHHIEGVKFHLCQMAHHGSVKNHSQEFWKNINSFKVQNAIASAGKKYKHPSIKVLKAFYNKGYEVYCTNIVNGMKELVDIIDEKSKLLDCFSELAEEYTHANNRVFEIKEGAVKLS